MKDNCPVCRQFIGKFPYLRVNYRKIRNDIMERFIRSEQTASFLFRVQYLSILLTLKNKLQSSRPNSIMIKFLLKAGNVLVWCMSIGIIVKNGLGGYIISQELVKILFRNPVLYVSIMSIFIQFGVRL